MVPSPETESPFFERLLLNVSNHQPLENEPSGRGVLPNNFRTRCHISLYAATGHDLAVSLLVRTPLGQISVEVWHVRDPCATPCAQRFNNSTFIELYLDKNEVGDDGAHTVQTVVEMRAAFLRA